MLLMDRTSIGNKLLAIRKRLGLTQEEVAERAGLSNRAYADIERGTVNMRIETFQQICKAFQVNPDEILTKENPALIYQQNELFERLNACQVKERETALRLLSVYLQSLN